MRILIIGGFGYIGSQLLDGLSGHPEFREAEITVADNWAYGRGAAPLAARFAERLPRFRHRCLDLSAPPSDAFRRLVARSTHIVNLASLTQIPNSELHHRYIVEGVANLAETIRREAADLRHAIDISSTSIYGPVRTAMPGTPEPYGEDVSPDPEIALHDYAASKLRAERIWRAPEYRDLPVTVFRLSTVFGYAVGMRTNQFVNRFLVDAVAGRRTILPGAPTNYRPHIHVRDATGFMLHLFEGDRAADGAILNVGAAALNPRLDALYESLAAMLRDEFGIVADYAFAADLGMDTIEESYRVDFSRFESMTNFRPEIDFLSGGRELVEKVRGG